MTAGPMTAGDTSPQLSVIVPTCRRPSALATLLEGLQPERQGLPASRYEIIVSDDDPAFTSAQLPRGRFPAVRFVEGPRRGPAANRNYGASHGRGEWLVFIDDDCVPAETWLRAIAAAIDGTAFDIIEGKIVAPDGRESLFRRDVENLNGGCYWSANLAIRGDVFRRLGGFDEDFGQAGGEDIEFAHRFQEHGARAVFCEAALISHPSHVMTWRGVFEWAFRMRWHTLYLLKTGQTLPVDASPFRTVPHVLASRSVALLRTTWHAVRSIKEGRSPAVMYSVVFNWVMAPVVFPYLAYWDLRFRRMLCNRIADGS